MRTLDSLPALAGKNVLVRCDLNVPLDEGRIVDDGRIRAALPTLRELREAGARVIVISHLGRPAGAPEPKYSLAPVAARMAELLGVDVAFATDTVGESARALVSELQDGDVLLLENLRFNPGEASKDAEERASFAGELASFAEYFVSDGFGVLHRSQASVTELAKALPSAAGRLVEAELDVMHKLTADPARPYVVVLGGSKVSDKLGVIGNLLQHVDTLLVGGGMVFTFLKAQGYKVASSLVEDDQLDTVRDYLRIAEERGVKVVLPQDIVVAEKFAADAAHDVVASDAIADTAFGDAGMGLDIGPAAAAEFAAEIAKAQTVFWNGPMGVYEMPAFANGTKAVAQALSLTEGFAVVGGGDSAAAVRALGFADSDFGHISTGGGASLEFLEGKQLPGVEVLV